MQIYVCFTYPDTYKVSDIFCHFSLHFRQHLSKQTKQGYHLKAGKDTTPTLHTKLPHICSRSSQNNDIAVRDVNIRANQNVKYESLNIRLANSWAVTRSFRSSVSGNINLSTLRRESFYKDFLRKTKKNRHTVYYIHNTYTLPFRPKVRHELKLKE